MGHHHRVYTGFNCVLEGRQLDSIEARPIASHFSNTEMRIGRRIAVPGKMLGGDEHPALMGAADIGRHKIADLRRISSEGTRVDDGIGGIGIHVGIGKEILMHADGSRFERGDAAKDFCILHFACGSEGHRMRKDGRAIQAHGNATLKISGDNQGQLRRSL